MNPKELRQKYIKFFKKKGHKVIPSASLIPENDPTVLFTTAGMHPLVPYLLGEEHPQGKKLVNFQKCIRTSDIDKVGNQWHLTFFEMLGNWSLNDYWKKEAIEWSFEFLTSPEWLNIPIDKIGITLFSRYVRAPKDYESFDIWKKLGISKEHIAFMGKADNWWGPAGKFGPCGPDTEMFYYIGKGKPGVKSNPKTEPNKWVEIWNNVFIMYNKKLKIQIKNTKISKTEEYEYESLEQKNIDTGMGLERTVAVLNNLPDVYHCEHIWPIVEKVEEISKRKYDESEKVKKAMRIITDHLRAAAFILGDEKGIAPSNVDQGYILRRLIRRAIRYGKTLGIEEAFTFKVAEVVINLMSDVYPELKKNKKFIVEQLVREEENFDKTLEKGLREFEKIVNQRSVNPRKVAPLLRGRRLISGYDAFILFSTYGFPLEMTKELAKEKGIEIAEKEFQEEFKKHQKLSRAGAEKRFKGGLIDHSEISKKYHTATHLLHQALRQILGEHVKQRGSNITAERLRFDFSHPEKMTSEQIQQVEDIVNEQIKKNLPVVCKEMTVEQAKKQGAIGLFEQKYGEKVKVYLIGSFSKEICGGPHVEKTGELGRFRIKKEESSSSGIRRIKAILG